jgi:hypothetical protein
METGKPSPVLARRGTVSGTNRDPDDWFAPEDPPQYERGGGRRARPPDDEDWLEERPPPRRAQGENALAFVKAHARALIAASGLALLLLIVLIAAGAFGGGGATPTPVTTTTPTPTVATTTPAPPTTALPPPPTTTLAPGSTGPQVVALQRALKALGFYTGKADGAYGPKTQAAVSAFQKSAGLTADGVVGPATLKQLTTALQSG